MIKTTNNFTTLLSDKLAKCKKIKISKKDLTNPVSFGDKVQLEQAANKIKEKTNPINDTFVKE